MPQSTVRIDGRRLKAPTQPVDDLDSADDLNTAAQCVSEIARLAESLRSTILILMIRREQRKRAAARAAKSRP